MVGVARIELATPAMSTQCSTTELHAHSGGDVEAVIGRRKHCCTQSSLPGPHFGETIREMTTVRIERRYRGPTDSGNGGYVAGIVAAALGGSNCTVTLLSPPPLERDLTLTTSDAVATLSDDDSIIVTATNEPVDVDVPKPPSFETARESEPRYTGLSHHIYPGCFVCGPERSAGDGMRIFPGHVGDPAAQVAATRVPDDSLANENGFVGPEFLWAALDCPGYFAAEERAGLALLGRMSATIHRPVRAGERLVVTGWPIASEGRKHRVGSALHDDDGNLVAAAVGTWITVSPANRGEDGAKSA
jgi:acyl-coenzyme A thioesterase PaaI-like protein